MAKISVAPVCLLPGDMLATPDLPVVDYVAPAFLNGAAWVYLDSGEILFPSGNPARVTAYRTPEGPSLPDGTFTVRMGRTIR